MLKKYYDLEKSDIIVMDGEEYIFQKVDGMYAHWIDSKGNSFIGQYNEYEQKEDGKWYPVI